ncbi:MAG: non-heme iron oxygenase ferredoxin subunit [Actinobacteria bacterium]|nr:non-heme iron oxygenase ferredoxin subunit [Actinomycetota bacterium]
MTWHQVVETNELELNKPVSIDIDGDPVMLVKTEQGIFALSDVCSHAEVALSEGSVQDGKVECWLHGAQFDLASGAAVCLPATKSVPSFPTRISNEVVVEVEIK